MDQTSIQGGVMALPNLGKRVQEYSQPCPLTRFCPHPQPQCCCSQRQQHLAQPHYLPLPVVTSGLTWRNHSALSSLAAQQLSVQSDPLPAFERPLLPVLGQTPNFPGRSALFALSLFTIRAVVLSGHEEWVCR